MPSTLDPVLCDAIRHSFQSATTVGVLHENLKSAGAPVSRAQLYRLHKNWREFGELYRPSSKPIGRPVGIPGDAVEVRSLQCCVHYLIHS